MKPRKIKLKTGAEILLGRNAEDNDELMKKFKGKENVILHTVAAGSPFCVIDSCGLKPSKEEIKEAGAHCVKYSQAWRNSKSDIKVHVFTGKDVKKPFFGRKTGTWKITKKAKVIRIKKEDVRKLK